jgi:PAS domain-containing protein
LELFIAHSPASLAMFDNDMKYIAASKQWIDEYDLDSQTLIGTSHYDLFPDLPLEWKKVHQRCLKGAVENNQNDFFIRPDGK